MVSDAVLLALIATIVPTVTAIGALIVSMRTNKKQDVSEARRESADKARAHRQRKTDPLEEQGRAIDSISDDSGRR